MSEMRLGKVAYALDGDGPLFVRVPWQLNSVLGKESRYPHLKMVPHVRREGINQDIQNPAEALSYAYHLPRWVHPEAAQAVKIMAEDGDHPFLITGRKNTKPWIGATKKSLKDAQILHLFHGLWFTPEGVSTVLSKISGVGRLREMYGGVEFVDDNVKTAVAVADQFPDVGVSIIKDRSTEKSLHTLGVSLSDFPNLSVVRNLLEILD